MEASWSNIRLLIEDTWAVCVWGGCDSLGISSTHGGAALSTLCSISTSRCKESIAWRRRAWCGDLLHADLMVLWPGPHDEMRTSTKKGTPNINPPYLRRKVRCHRQLKSNLLAEGINLRERTAKKSISALLLVPGGEDPYIHTTPLLSSLAYIVGAGT